MIKYRTNSKIGHFFGTHTEVAHDQLTEWFTLLGIKCLVSDGIIVEIQEPEFTRDDMTSFVRYVESLPGSPCYNEQLNNWIKNKQ